MDIKQTTIAYSPSKEQKQDQNQSIAKKGSDLRLPKDATIYIWRMSFWKRPIIRRFLEGHRIYFVRTAKKIKPGSCVLLWGSQPVPLGLNPNHLIIRVEDGFLRSVGLGADLTRPISWVIDTRGIYYDSTCPSDLEYLLQHCNFAPDLIKRAVDLHQRLIKQGITKYNIQGKIWQPKAPDGKRIILVPGQVESDASITYGAGKIRSNLALVQEVRKQNPDAWIIYKPHPDVVAGLRCKGANEHHIPLYCDEYLKDVSIDQALNYAHEVHVITSLAGFEGLLRGKRVTCYGMPFYAGWGLTLDVNSISRRTRILTIQELVVASLLLYPTYISWIKKKRVSAEEALNELILHQEKKGGGKVRVFCKVFFRKILQLSQFVELYFNKNTSLVSCIMSRLIDKNHSHK
ncbi:MAG: beta-3-deoxy-D-manno-oct-2-ulosonic acid transferase [Legionella sp.]|nr:beta-3-deoxy-D-manno-oct-2-ulosonic acid transferase [Legionella sp.]